MLHVLQLHTLMAVTATRGKISVLGLLWFVSWPNTLNSESREGHDSVQTDDTS